jgi:hypothetical protein
MSLPPCSSSGSAGSRGRRSGPRYRATDWA